MPSDVTTYFADANSTNSSPFNNSLTFPDRPECFQIENGLIFDPDCGPVTTSMLDFLNITDAKKYFDAYCLDPPDDSCAFGFCPNPDIAGPAVRYSTYVTNICLAVVVWYQPDDAKDSFYAQILTVYSLVIAAIIAIAEHELTKIHAFFAVIAAASPLSIYLFLYAIRATFGHRTRLHSVFGTERWINRVITLVIFPVWLALLIFLALPAETYHFQQAACEFEGTQHFGTILLAGPILAVFLDSSGSPLLQACLILTIVPFVAWGVAVFLQRREIWDGSKKLPLKQIWKVPMKHYPFIEFSIALFLPHMYWLLSLEVGAALAVEPFEADYGQLLAIFVAVPPTLSALALLPRLGRWFWDLSWVRFLRRAGPRYEQTSATDSDSPDGGLRDAHRDNLTRTNTSATFLVPLRDADPNDIEMFQTYAADIASPPTRPEDEEYGRLRDDGPHYEGLDSARARTVSPAGDTTIPVQTPSSSRQVRPMPGAVRPFPSARTDPQAS